MTCDRQRSKVYAAETRLHWLSGNGGTVELPGMVLQLEPEARFGDLDSIGGYVRRVLAHPAVVARFGEHPPIAVRHRRGHTAAHYEERDRTIAVYTQGTRWAMRELVVLHEIAHALAPSDGHGPDFAATMLELVDAVIGPQTALALRVLYGDAGVTT
jgi:putative metallohydrolase (TIGR04338 family)